MNGEGAGGIKHKPEWKNIIVIQDSQRDQQRSEKGNQLHH